MVVGDYLTDGVPLNSTCAALRHLISHHFAIKTLAVIIEKLIAPDLHLLQNFA
jgi:hypothetical protein